jgi:Bacterial regulatory proteins, luxR family
MSTRLRVSFYAQCADLPMTAVYAACVPAGRGAAELFISRTAVEYHLGNIYAKCGVQGRQQLRRFVDQWRQPAAV